MPNLRKNLATTSTGPLVVSGGHTIKVIAARTGLEMGTLRAWERRYGFPRPSRREGSNRRLYSNDDLTRLLAIKRLLDAGYRVGDVIQKPLSELAPLTEKLPGPVAAPTSDLPSPRTEPLLALLVEDRVNELEVELRYFAAALGPRRFVTELAHPFAVSVGRGWAEGRISVQQEHLATECLITELRQLLAAYQDVRGTPLVLLATLPGEQHTLPLQMVALYLVLAGARPRLLGGPTPPKQIAESARVLGADVVGVGITVAAHQPQLSRDLASLRATLQPRTRLWLGGSNAASVSAGLESTTLVDSWSAIDRAIADCRRGAL